MCPVDTVILSKPRASAASAADHRLIILNTFLSLSLKWLPVPPSCVQQLGKIMRHRSVFLPRMLWMRGQIRNGRVLECTDVVLNSPDVLISCGSPLTTATQEVDVDTNLNPVWVQLRQKHIDVGTYAHIAASSVWADVFRGDGPAIGMLLWHKWLFLLNVM